MNIIPISGMPLIAPLAQNQTVQNNGTAVPFKDMLKNAVGDLEELNAVKDQDAIDLALGNIDDIGQVQVNAQKAEVALQLLVQMRNKILDGYNEIMRMNV